MLSCTNNPSAILKEGQPLLLQAALAHPIPRVGEGKRQEEEPRDSSSNSRRARGGGGKVVPGLGTGWGGLQVNPMGAISRPQATSCTALVYLNERGLIN